MIIKKNLGIWMDHSNAHLMELNDEPIKTTSIQSKFTHEVKEESLHKSENLMHNKEQHQQSAYYKKLGDTIKNYNEVILFGPTNAKVELYNLLKEDNHFADINIQIKNAPKMTENQQHAFVREHFKKV
ncbi:MAG: hypothetical protein ABIO44_04920 [Saprospiraceae bacterium]